jgi:hypothetical protein
MNTVPQTTPSKKKENGFECTDLGALCPLRFHGLRPVAVDDIVTGSCTDIVELFLSVLTLFCGVWLFFSTTLFDAALYRVMTTVLPQEWMLATVMVVIGASRVVALLRGWLRLRKLVAFWGFMLWIMLSLSYMFSGWVGLSIPITGTLSVMSLWVYWRLPSRPTPTES